MTGQDFSSAQVTPSRRGCLANAQARWRSRDCRFALLSLMGWPCVQFVRELTTFNPRIKNMSNNEFGEMLVRELSDSITAGKSAMSLMAIHQSTHEVLFCSLQEHCWHFKKTTTLSHKDPSAMKPVMASATATDFRREKTHSINGIYSLRTIWKRAILNRCIGQSCRCMVSI